MDPPEINPGGGKQSRFRDLHPAGRAVAVVLAAGSLLVLALLIAAAVLGAAAGALWLVQAAWQLLVDVAGL